MLKRKRKLTTQNRISKQREKELSSKINELQENNHVTKTIMIVQRWPENRNKTVELLMVCKIHAEIDTENIDCVQKRD